MSLVELDDTSESEAFVESSDDLHAVDYNVVTETVLFTTDWTVETVISQINKRRIILNPRWQRRDAWDLKKKTDLIESVMLNFPVPPIVLAEVPKERGHYLVIDGKQRLLTLRQFYAEEDDSQYNHFRVGRPQILHQIRGHSYSSMSEDIELRQLLAGFENYPIRTIIVRNWRDENILYGIFLRLNNGSQKLYPQELRQALHPGPFIDYADTASGGALVMRDIFRRDGPDFRMRDTELLIRYIGFHTHAAQYRGNLKDFLDRVVLSLNHAWPEKEGDITALVAQLDEAHRFVAETFTSANMYRKWNGAAYERPFNRAVFDIMTYAFSFNTVREALVGRKPEIEQAFKNLCGQDEFRRSIEVTTKSLEATWFRFNRWTDELNRLAGRDLLSAPAVPEAA